MDLTNAINQRIREFFLTKLLLNQYIEHFVVFFFFCIWLISSSIDWRITSNNAVDDKEILLINFSHFTDYQTLFEFNPKQWKTGKASVIPPEKNGQLFGFWLQLPLALSLFVTKQTGDRFGTDIQSIVNQLGLEIIDRQSYDRLLKRFFFFKIVFFSSTFFPNINLIAWEIFLWNWKYTLSLDFEEVKIVKFWGKFYYYDIYKCYCACVLFGAWFDWNIHCYEILTHRKELLK